MIQNYLNAVMQALSNVLQLLIRLALPIAILGGLLFIAASVAWWNRRTSAGVNRSGEDGGENNAAAWPLDGRRVASGLGGYLLTGLVLVSCWAALRASLPIARQNTQWRESAQATTNPVPDAPPVEQYGPSVAVLAERTYSRNLTLPPDFLQRIGENGVGVLAPYLSDPSADEVTRLSDTFRKSGSNVILTRQVTRIDEEPVPFKFAQVRVQFKHLSGRAYDAQFEGRYAFQNPNAAPANMRLTFPLPQAGTIRDVSMVVGGQAIADPNTSDASAFEWKASVGAGETREVVVRYQVVGAQTWRYDMGSRRRRVQKFGLEATTKGSVVRFLRGSLTPTTTSADGDLRWELDNVVTAQQVALSFAPSTAGEQLYMQSLSALPASLGAFLLLACVLMAGAYSVNRKRHFGPLMLAIGLALFTLGLGAAPVLSNYVGFVGALLFAPLAGSLLVARVLGWRFLLAAVPAALIPAAFLSAQHTGALLLLLSVVTLFAFWRFVPRPTQGNSNAVQYEV